MDKEPINIIRVVPDGTNETRRELKGMLFEVPTPTKEEAEKMVREHQKQVDEYLQGKTYKVTVKNQKSGEEDIAYSNTVVLATEEPFLGGCQLCVTKDRGKKNAALFLLMLEKVIKKMIKRDKELKEFYKEAKESIK